MRSRGWLQWALICTTWLLIWTGGCNDGTSDDDVDPTFIPLESPPPEGESPTPASPTPASSTPAAGSPTPDMATRTPGEATPTPDLTSPTPLEDADHDGFTVEEGDCDDDDPDRYPGAGETPYDGVDQDCSGSDLTDVDGDGYEATQVGGDDCNDDNAATHPGATEIGDGEDNDCNGEVDEGVDTVDNDLDGYSELEGDCDDTDPDVHPDAEEIPYDGIDQDCSGADLSDVDGDGTAGGPEGLDCDDGDSSIHPGADEVPYDGIDQDCSGGDLSDVDGDGASGGEGGGGSVPTDCDDNDPALHPGAEDVPYDGVDQDCSGADLTDVDQDGHSAAQAGGDDCDDQDAAAYPQAQEVPYDGVDQDCDGGDLTDVDGDGYDATQAGGDDCDDHDVNTYPGAPEFADSKDNDCDGQIDEGLDSSDDDHDGYSEQQGDCDDVTTSTYPGALEIPYDGVDQDCSGADLTDVDGDGYPASQAGGNDCNDGNAQVHPTASEVAYDGIDQDCSGGDLTDVDGDGFDAAVVGGADCNDTNAQIHPGVKEVPYDGIDQDCSGKDLTDVDGDGYDATAVGGADCADNNVAISPKATEVCDGIDNNCDNVVDTDAVDRKTWYTDADHDGYGNAASPVLACSQSGNLVTDSTDCDDTTARTYPGAAEVCDAKDNDCDGVVDEGVQNTYYQDADKDSYGNPNQPIQACTAPAGYVTNNTDCKDTNDEVNPAASERCNGADDNCNGQIDENVNSAFYQDADHDGYGDPKVAIVNCNPPTGFVSNNLDCNDQNASVHPNAAELCNGLDDDCDAQIDEGVKTTFYKDGDNDGFGDPSQTLQACLAPTGYVAIAGDCNDASAAIKPGATEACNGLDDDCDGDVDEFVKTTFYKDGDGDGYGSSSQATQACTAPPGYVSVSGDCDDTNAAIKPGATELCNGIDDDCDLVADDGVKTTFYRDADADGYGAANSTTQACAVPSGYVSNAADCDDTRASVNPAATEACNGLDDDCDALIDENVKVTFYKDADADGYGATSVTTQACTAPSGYASSSGDCDDANPAINPGASELCNSIDDNCDSKVDDVDADKDSHRPTTCGGDDCDDTSAATYAGAPEICDNAVDENCDGRDHNCWGTAKLGSAKWHP